MTNVQTSPNQFDTNSSVCANAICCGIHYEMRLTKKGVYYFPLHDKFVAVTQCIGCCELLNMNNISQPDESHNDDHVQYDEDDRKKECEQWHMLKQADPMSGFIKILSLIGKMAFVTALLIGCYRICSFIWSLWQ